MVKIVDGIFDEDNESLARTLREATGAETPRVMLFADINVVQQSEGLGSRIGRYLSANGISLCAKPVILAGGEKIKCDGLASFARASSSMLDAKIGCKDVVVALGGGTLLDVVGYAAAQVRGGVKIVRIPTTVAAMIDAAWADTAALNSPNVKDAYRIPCRAEAVLEDPAFARTVLDGVWRAGFSEAARLAAACDAELMEYLLQAAPAIRKRDEKTMFEVVERCMKIRENCDPKNFGEWSAIRLESMSNYKLPHGYAIAIGTMIDATYSMLKGFLSKNELTKLAEFMTGCGAMDGAVHSRHLVGQVDTLMYGLDAWELAYGDEGIFIPDGLGKLVQDKKPDREAMRKAINMIK